MVVENNVAKDVKIAYIGGGSQGWAWGLMSDLAKVDDMTGSVALYDIDIEAARKNETIGNRIKDGNSGWKYNVCETIGEALTGADFVVISILPGTIEEFSSDIHTAEKYGIYQSVADSTGPGGIIRALRTVPMFEEFALAIKEYCPNAWVINYTNPMTICINTLYRVFPEIKAFGCCHEVFGTQSLLMDALEEECGIKAEKRSDMKVNVIGVNHFTWLTSANYKNIDMFPVYRRFAEKYRETGRDENNGDIEINKAFKIFQKVKFDLFLRYGWIAAAGDRHLAEFCPGDWYLQTPEMVEEKWKFGLTTIENRRKMLSDRVERGERLLSGEEEFEIKVTGEEGIDQMRAICGLTTLCTNVNLPNYGQIPNLPLGTVVETNAVFSAGNVRPVFAGAVPENILPLISRVSAEQEMVTTAALNRDLDMAFNAFAADPLVRLSLDDARKLFDEMVANTSKYLGMYNI